MWLTDYIPQPGVPVQVTCVLAGVANRQVGPNITVAPTPNCAEVGDWQVLCLSWWTNDVPNWNVTGIGYQVGDWWTVSYASTSSFVDNPLIFIRKITVGNINTPFTIGAASGATGISYITWIMKSEILDTDPVIGTAMTGSAAGGMTSFDNPFPGSRGWSPTSLPTVSDLDLILTTNGWNQLLPFIPAESARVPLARTSNTNVAAGIAVILQRQALDPYVDLNGGGHPLDGWTGSNVTINLTPTNIARAYEINEQAVSGVRHGIWKDFTFEAGKVYDFTFDSGSVGITSTGAGETCTYLGYIDPLGVEHGYASNESVNTPCQQIGTQVTVANYIRHYGYSNNGLGGFRYTTTLRINAQTTGTYRLWVGFIQQFQLATAATTLFNRTGNTSRAFRGSSLRVLEIKEPEFETLGGAACKRNNSLYRDYYHTDRLLAPDRRNQTTSQNRTGYTVLRGTAGSRPILRMGGPAIEHMISQSPSPNRTVTNTEQYPYSAQSYHFEYSDHSVGRWIAEKFYYEATVTAYSVNQFFGVSLAGPPQFCFISTLPGSGEWWGVRSGTKYLRGVASATGTWVQGDVIGVLVDYTAGEVAFYKNGGLITSGPMSTDPKLRNAMFKMMISRSWAGVSDEVGRYVLNTRGPFLYKPPGAVPFDFDNAVLDTPGELFTADGTWTKPDGIAGAYVYVVGAGGGGGSGIVGSYANTYNGGGTGGGGGGVSYAFIGAASLGPTEAVTVGAGGAGGAAVGPSNSFLDGNTGSPGGSSSFGAFLTAGGGGGGNRGYTGNSNNGVGGAGGTGSVSTGGGGWRMALNGTGASVNGTENGSAAAGPGGGGGGGGCTIVGGFQSYDACIGGDAPVDNVPAAGAAGTNGVPPTAGQTPTAAGPGEAGAGGGGGGSHVTAGGIPAGVSADGANGGLYGGGGGGGGAGVSYGGSNFGTGGAGGNGAGGCVYIVPVY